ncbi:unnamed protein product [Blepharisma stoltei]|uniref:Uncharacterized protein n=1 Tax=Blepharisma stoltei TaxID=1481888 RepID=A0AAU9I604_9CILI|nr:unnamed protein product [Blepharisma stoltei]
MEKFSGLLSLWIFFSLTSSTSLQVIKAQNFGSSSSYLSSNSITFPADSTGSSCYYSSISTSSTISHTKDQTLYQTGLWVSLDSHYKFSIDLADGDYVLILRFAEIQYDSAASRVFSMNFCGQSLFEFLDIYQLTGGKNIAVDFFYEFSVLKSIVKYQSSNYDLTKNKGQLDFEIISVIDKGIINALQIIKGSCKETKICDNCYDPLCNKCDYTTGICEECIYNAELNDKNYCSCPSKADDGSIIAILSAPKQACSACMVKLDGTGSIGSGGLNYAWIVDGLTKSTESVFYYTVPDLSVQTTTNVTLKVTDSCGFQNSTSWTISIVKESVIVDIKEYDLSYDTSKYSSFSADSVAVGNGTVQKYEWSVTPLVKGLKNPNQKDISIQFPSPDTYSISLTVFMDNGKYGGDVATISVMPEVPIIFVTGVNSTYNNFTTVTFSATFLYQNGTYSKNYAIDYQISYGCPKWATFRRVGNGDFVFKSYGEVKDYYTCYFYVTAEIYSGFNASTLCYLNITSTPVPEVYVTYPKSYFDPTAPIRFMANIPDQTNLVFHWEQTDNNTKIDPAILNTPRNQSSYTIPERCLEPQKEYEFTIHVRNTKTNATADVSTRRWVNSPPKFGTFTVTPTSGTVLETPFSTVFQGFVDPEKNLPISYQIFQVQSNGKTVAITSKTSSNNFNITIGESNGKVPLIGRVYDSLGTFADLSFNLTVNPSSVGSNDQAKNLLNNGANMDQTLYLSSIVAISQYTFQNPTSGASTESVVSTLLQALNNWSDSKEMTDIDVSTTFDVISVFLNESTSYGEELIQNISKSLDNALSKADTLDDNTYKVFIKQVDIVSGRSSQILSNGESKNNNATYADIWAKLTNSVSLSSEKCQKKTNPNEPIIEIQGDTFNVTLESKDYKTVKNVNYWNTNLSNCTVAFETDAAKDSGNIVYHIPIITTNNFGNVSASMQPNLPKFFQIVILAK